MWETVLVIRHYGCPVSDLTERFPGIQLQNLSKSNMAADRSKRILRVLGPPEELDEFTDVFPDHERVSRFRCFGDNGKRSRYFTTVIEYDPTTPSIAKLVNDNGCFQHNAVNVRKGDEHWTVYSERKSAVQSVIDDVREHGNDVVVHRSIDCSDLQSSGSMQFTSLHKVLTPQQRLAFQTALEEGYYGQGNDVTMETIGEELDLHSSTAWEHLKKAENTILTEVGKHIFPQ